MEGSYPLVTIAGIQTPSRKVRSSSSFRGMPGTPTPIRNVTPISVGSDTGTWEPRSIIFASSKHITSKHITHLLRQKSKFFRTELTLNKKTESENVAQEAAPGIKWAPGFNPESSSSRAPVKPAPNPDELVIVSSDDECKFLALLPCRC